MLMFQLFWQLWPTVKKTLKRSVAFHWPGKESYFKTTEFTTNFSDTTEFVQYFQTQLNFPDIFRNRTKSDVIETCSSASTKFISGVFIHFQILWSTANQCEWKSIWTLVHKKPYSCWMQNSIEEKRAIQNLFHLCSFIGEPDLSKTAPDQMRAFLNNAQFTS